MSKFIKINDIVLNVEDIRKVEFLGDDIYLSLFPKDQNGECLVDFVPFDFARIHTLSKELIVLSLHLYSLEEDESEDEWINRNRAYISMTMAELYEVLKPIKIGNKEYELEK